MITGIATVILLLAFVGGVAWAYSKNRKPEFDAAARIPLEDTSEISPGSIKSGSINPGSINPGSINPSEISP